MKDYLNVIITSPDGEREWQRQGIAVPRTGDEVIIRDDNGLIFMEGIVKNVCWSYRTESAGAVVSVWLE